ncbi:hypothetical protein CVR98_25520 [Salmonella enterica subsp. enterica serovar Enteritidis]|nr:hypothetical protein CVR98_25520 [Salmonella enterica subsp. enterica serovar Enteritidis]
MPYAIPFLETTEFIRCVVHTDTRQGHQGNQDKIDAMENTGENQTEYINLYLTGLIKTRGEILTSVDDLVKSVGKHLNKDK